MIKAFGRLLLSALISIATHAVDRPVALRSNATNQVAANIEALWFPEVGVCKTFSNHVFVPKLRGLIPARHLAGGKWSSIYPVLAVTQTNFIVGEVAAEKSFRLAITNKGELRIEVAANRLGSQLDPVLRLLDSKGHELAVSDDDPFLGRDSVVQSRTRAPSTIELRDVANEGGANYFFVLSTSAEPLIPPTLQATNSFGEGIYTQRFEAHANQKLIISVATRLHGSPCDASLTVTSDTGTVIGESTGAGPDGPAITNRFQKAGAYEARVRELSKLRGLPFWLSIEEARPGIELTTETERVDIPKDGETKLKIICRRFDYDGPVTLKVDGLPPGVEILDKEIPEKKGEVELRFKRVAGEAQSFNAQITGITKVGEFRVSTMPALRKLFPLQMFPLQSMDGWIAVNVSL